MGDLLPWLLAVAALGLLVGGLWHHRRVAARRLEEQEAMATLPATAAPVSREPDAQADALRLAAERDAAERAQAEYIEAQRAEGARLDAERQAAAQREAAWQAEQQRLLAEFEAAQRVEAERAEAARLEAERAAAAQAEAERQCLRAEQEAVQRAEAERVEAARLEAERAEAERQRQQAEQEAAQRAELQRLEAEREAEREAAARAEQERVAAERAAAAAREALERGPAVKTAAQTMVLVADDSKVVRIKTGRLLMQHQYQVSYASDGLDAVQQLQQSLPDLVITDVEMPGMDGFELTRHIRADPRSARLPVIMITAADDRHREHADAAGVSVLLGKPYPEDLLIAHIRQALGQEECSPQDALA